MDLSRPVSVGHINYAGSVPGEWQATVYVSLPALRPPTTQLRLLSTPLNQLPAHPPRQLLLLPIQHEQTYIHISFSFCNLSLTPPSPPLPLSRTIRAEWPPVNWLGDAVVVAVVVRIKLHDSIHERWRRWRTQRRLHFRPAQPKQQTH